MAQILFKLILLKLGWISHSKMFKHFPIERNLYNLPQLFCFYQLNNKVRCPSQLLWFRIKIVTFMVIPQISAKQIINSCLILLIWMKIMILMLICNVNTLFKKHTKSLITNLKQLQKQPKIISQLKLSLI